MKLPANSMGRLAVSCRKPGCKTGSDRIHRHHRGCERMFLTHFYSRRESKRYKAFKTRYEGFFPEDVVEVCDSHHAEIHAIYMRTIRDHCLRLQMPMARWSWNQAFVLIKDLRVICDRWMKQETPGMDPERLNDRPAYEKIYNYFTR